MHFPLSRRRIKNRFQAQGFDTTLAVTNDSKNLRTVNLVGKEEFLSSLPQWTIIQHYKGQYHHHTQCPPLRR